MKTYKTKTKRLAGTSYPEIRKKAFGLYQKIKRKSKRKPYVRSAYFKKNKIFLTCSGAIYLKIKITGIK